MTWRVSWQLDDTRATYDMPGDELGNGISIVCAMPERLGDLLPATYLRVSVERVPEEVELIELVEHVHGPNP